MKKAIKESADQKYIREFINHVCNGDLATANSCLDAAVKTKVKTLVQRTLKETE